MVVKRKVQICLLSDESSYSISFNAMASPCEILIQTKDENLACKLGEVITNEVWRIEDKYSRYNQSGICSLINQNAGKKTAIDHETFLLLTFAQQCFELSDGLFDITSGILRKVWYFDGSSNLPSKKQVNKVIQSVGWKKLSFDQHQIHLNPDMEVDFGGIGKEYAVDRCILLAKKLTDTPVLVNLGGDLAVTSARNNNQAWHVAIEHPDFDSTTTKQRSKKNQDMIVSLYSGALATSGDARKFLMKNGQRYGHILNAKTGWPIVKAPRSITVVAPQCVQAGILATLALLQGEKAEKFLNDQEVKYWSRR